MNVPYQAMVVGTNEVSKKFLTKKNITPGFFTYFGCASVAGLVASLITMPLDNIKTKMNTQCDLVSLKSCPDQFKCVCEKDQKGNVKYSTALKTARQILRQEGMGGFFRGMVPRGAIQSLSTAISWSSYEMAKKTFSVKARH